MIDHISLLVGNYEKSKAFYSKALSPLGLELVKEHGKAGGFGPGGKPEFWIVEAGSKISKGHVAFGCSARKDVDAFYQAAMAAGGMDNGKPEIQADYHPNYYGGFVFDPDGHNIEAVCHAEGKP